MKTSYGRIPRGPHEITGSLTVTVGPLCRSVRDITRWLDVCNGYDTRDRFSLPRVEGWEAGLGTREVRGLRAVVAPDLQGTALVHPMIIERVEQAAKELIGSAGLRQVDATISLPEPGPSWGLAGLVSAVVEFGHLSAEEMQEQFTSELGTLLPMAIPMYNADHAARVETFRVAMVDAMAGVWDQTDLVICATNPDTPFAAAGPVPSSIGGVLCNPFNAGALTIPGNITGCPGISIPIGNDDDGRPVGMQVYAPHYREDVLLDLALAVERDRPWPLVAPVAPV